MRALLVVVLLLLGLASPGRPGRRRHRRGQGGGAGGRQGGLQGTPAVDITGFPFLTQALSGTYDDVRIALTAEELGQPAGTRADIALHGVHVPLSSVLSGSVDQVPVDRIDGTATLSYALLAASSAGTRPLRREGDGLRITKTVEVLGQTIPLTAVGTVALDGNELVVDVEQAPGAGVEVPEFLGQPGQRPARPALHVPALPFGLQLTGVDAAEDGVDSARGGRTPS
jgi:hypothetical protein